MSDAGAVEIRTGLSASACLAQLERAALDDDPFDPLRARHEPVLLRVDGRRVVARNVADGMPPHALRRMLYGEVVDTPAGASLRGRFQLHRTARIGLTLWFACTVAIVLLLVAGNLTGGLEPAPGMSGVAAIALPAVILAAAAMLVRTSLQQSRAREEAIVNFLRAVVRTPGTPASHDERSASGSEG